MLAILVSRPHCSTDPEEILKEKQIHFLLFYCISLGS